jgi:hypothetical protein
LFQAKGEVKGETTINRIDYRQARDGVTVIDSMAASAFCGPCSCGWSPSYRPTIALAVLADRDGFALLGSRAACVGALRGLSGYIDGNALRRL